MSTITTNHYTPQPQFGISRRKLGIASIVGVPLAALALAGCGDSDAFKEKYNQPCTTPEPVELITPSSTPIDITVSHNFTGRFIHGTWGSQPVELRVDHTLTGENIYGDFQGNPVALKIRPDGLTDTGIKGRFHCNPTDINISPGWAKNHVSGTFNGKPVDFKVYEKFFGSEIKGTFNGFAIDLQVSYGIGGRNIEGTFAGQPVNWEVDHNWTSNHVTGTTTLSQEEQSDLLATIMIESTIADD